MSDLGPLRGHYDQQVFRWSVNGPDCSGSGNVDHVITPTIFLLRPAEFPLP